MQQVENNLSKLKKNHTAQEKDATRYKTTNPNNKNYPDADACRDTWPGKEVAYSANCNFAQILKKEKLMHKFTNEWKKRLNQLWLKKYHCYRTQNSLPVITRWRRLIVTKVSKSVKRSSYTKNRAAKVMLFIRHRKIGWDRKKFQTNTYCLWKT